MFFFLAQVLLREMKLLLSMVPLCPIWIWCIWKVFYKKNKLYAWWWGKMKMKDEFQKWKDRNLKRLRCFLIKHPIYLSAFNLLLTCYIYTNIYPFCLLIFLKKAQNSNYNFISNHFNSRSSRVEPPDLAGILRSTDDIIESLVCPPPPSDAVMSEEMISGLIVPAPNWSKSSLMADSWHFW